MNSAKLLSVLNSLSAVKESFYTINWGGCGVFALYLSDELNNRNIKHEIIWIGDSGNSVRTAKNRIQKVFKNNSNASLQHFRDCNVSLSHVMIRIGRKYIDATGVAIGFENTDWSYRSILTKMSNDELRSLVNEPKGWNDSFNRSLIPKVKEQIETIMKNLD